jgi:hypothetical protein
MGAKRPLMGPSCREAAGLSRPNCSHRGTWCNLPKSPRAKLSDDNPERFEERQGKPVTQKLVEKQE